MIRGPLTTAFSPGRRLLLLGVAGAAAAALGGWWWVVGGDRRPPPEPPAPRALWALAPPGRGPLLPHAFSARRPRLRRGHPRRRAVDPRRRLLPRRRQRPAPLEVRRRRRDAAHLRYPVPGRRPPLPRRG